MLFIFNTHSITLPSFDLWSDLSNRRALTASRTDRADPLEEERQIQEAICLSVLGKETNSHQPRSDTADSSKKRGREEEPERNDNKRARPKRSPRLASGSACTGSRPSDLALSFPNGALRITRTPGRQKDKNCVNLGDVIHKKHLISACIFSFFIAKDELFRYLPLSGSHNDVPVSIMVLAGLVTMLIVRLDLYRSGFQPKHG